MNKVGLFVKKDKKAAQKADEFESWLKNKKIEVVRKESLPENVPEQVMAMWRDGSERDSLGLLYRATLSRLIQDYDFNFNESATEKECADIVSNSGMKDIDSYLQGLTITWQRLAYGHRLPGEPEVITLCENWPEIFVSEN